MTVMSLEQEIKDRVLALGFDAVGITDMAPLGAEHAERFEAWLRAGCAGRMEYMHRNLERRLDPAQLRKGAKSVIVVALNYQPPAPAVAVTSNDPEEMVGTAHPTRGRVAQYAQYEDYHLFIKDLLRELAGFVCLRAGHQDRYKICVDSAPVAEKALAVRAGLGFIGRNHLLIHPQLGPQILLGELFTSVPLTPDQPMAETCLDCRRCLEACPTGALRPDGLLDARRCISYLTQYEAREEENNGTHAAQHSTIPIFHHSISVRGWLFGCDECLRACPFHQKAPARADRRFRFYPERANIDLRDLLALTPVVFETKFHDSPIRRLGLEKLKYNARCCLE
jgi:epoxyqueuosine reductase